MRGAVIVGLLAVTLAGTARALTYATVTDVKAIQLTNGIQITVKADGILDWSPEGYDGWHGGDYSGRDRQIGIRIPSARSTVNNFVDVSMYPVSYVQTYVPQDAAQGVGVCLVVGCFTASDYSVASSPDRQSIIITVKSTRTLDSSDTKTTDIGEQKTELTCKCENGLLSVQALKTEMLKVFGEIAKSSGINLVVDDTVAKRTVSMSLTNMKPEDVLQNIASAYGLSLSNQDGVYMVSEGVPTGLSTYRASDTQSFPMKFVRAQTASELLPTFLYSYLHVNSEQNAVVVSAPSQMLDKIKKDLAKVDIAPPQIMIEAIVIELSSANDLDVSLGLNGESGNSGQFTADTKSGGITYTTVGLLPNNFQAKLRALVVQHKAKIHSTPRMAVVNGGHATINVGADRFVKVEYMGYGQNSEKIQGVPVGTKIDVTPWTGGNGEITVTVSPEVSNIVELDRVSGLPTLASRRASTTVRVKDGETIVIGGLTQRQEYVTNRKVPILGDLPIVGALFRSKSKSSTDTELVFLITPRILTDSGHLPNAEEEAQIKSRMLGKTGKDAP